MPNIKELQTPNLGLQPSEIGVESVAAAARRGGAFFNQAAQSLDTLGTRIGGAIRDAGDAAVAYEDHREISAGAAAYADLLNVSTADWNTTAKNADPNDPSVAQKWREESLEPRLDAFMSGFSTQNSQKWAEAHVDQLRNHFVEKTTADMSSAAADAVHVNAVKTLNGLSATVYQDPSALDMSIKSLGSTIGGVADSSPNLTPDVANKVKSELSLKGTEQIVKSAIMGAIANGGDWKRIADKYPDYVNAAEMAQFARQERYYTRLDEAQTKAAKRDADNEAKDKLNRDLVNLDLSIADDEGNVNVTKDHIRQLTQIFKNNQAGAGFERATLEHELDRYGRAIERQKRIQAATDDPATVADLNARIGDPQNPTSMLQIALAKNDGKISPRTERNLAGVVRAEKGELQDQALKTTLGGAKQMLGTDPKGAEKYNGFWNDFIPEYLRQKKAGTLPPNALHLDDEKSLIRQYMQPHQRSPLEIYQDRATHGLATSPEDFAGITVTGTTAVPSGGYPSPPQAALRKADTVYQTPRGPLKWTGTGWVNP